MSRCGFGGWGARGVCLGLVLSYASESLAQSTASFPAPSNAGTAKPAPPVTSASPPAPPPAPHAPSAAPAASSSATAKPAAATQLPPETADRSLPPTIALPPTSPSLASGFYPALLPYRQGLPIPPGYRVEHRAAKGLIYGGLSTLLIAYTTAVVLGAGADLKDGTGWLVVPVIGPWAAIGARSYHCDNNPAHANSCVSGAFSEVQTIAILSADAVVQATGAVLFIAGLASGRDELVRNDLTAKVRISPRALGANGVGLGVDGRF